MKEELVKFVLENGLSPFSSGRSSLGVRGESIYKTRDAKAIHAKVLSKLSSGFVFSESSNLWNFFGFTDDFKEIEKRQSFFKGLLKNDGVRDSGCRGVGEYLKEIGKPRDSWKPRYDVIVVTENEATFVKLNGLGCGVQLIMSERDVQELERYDIVQVVDCDDFSLLLERLPQSVFLDSVEDVYLERYLEEISGWRENFALLRKEQNSSVVGSREIGGSDVEGSGVSREIGELLKELEPLFLLLENKEGKIISESEAERILGEVNEAVSEKIKEMTISGEAMMKMLSEGKMPTEILEIVRGAIEASGLSEHIFNLQIPVTIDYKELESQIKRQSVSEFTDLAGRVKRAAGELKRVPKILERLSALLLVEDFCNGVANWVVGSGLSVVGSEKKFPNVSENLYFSDAVNMFLNNGQPISFQLDKFSRCSILTGANSGGKTTLLEHVLQNISLFQLGLPIDGEIHLPMFSDVYYFAKTKGSTSKGAFETLLTQLSKVSQSVSVSECQSVSASDGKVLILADEIEAVTEPGVAGKIISATADFFIRKGCYLILATHLGAEIAKSLPEGARIDGIEAKGLDENFNLIVDHNPVMGRLAHSTPELIVERLALQDEAGSRKSEVGREGVGYFKFLFEAMKSE
ncbi:MAG: hypothetical protein KJ592_03210 [Nanoarchaeota archaeon]|nr:hypothetical protein [Nanoarchaeota archaeon]